MSYSTVARSSRRRNGPVKADGGHKREHSANTAGDVFAMFGGGGAGLSGGSSAGAAEQKESKPQLERERQKSAGADSASSSSVETPSGSSDDLATSSSLGRQTGPANSKRFQSLYPKPVLLSLWSKDRTAKLQHDDLLYSSFESYDQQRLNTDMHDVTGSVGQSQRYSRHQYDPEKGGDRLGLDREKSHLRRTTPAEYSGALGRLPTGSATVNGQPHQRRQPSGGSLSPADRYGGVGIQGGVLGGIGGSSERRKPAPSASTTETGDESFDASQSRLRGSARQPNYGHRAEPEKPSTPAWNNTKWRHLRDETGSSSSSKSSKSEEDPWTAETGWKPPAKDPIKEGRNEAVAASAPSQAVSASDSLADWDDGVSDRKGPTPPSEMVDPAIVSASLPEPSQGSANTAHTAGQAKSTLFVDDLLAPIRSMSFQGQNGAHQTSPAVAGTSPVPNPQVTAARRPEPLRQQSGYQTPTRSSTAEALEILARRSPVNSVHPEYSMAAPQPAMRAERPESIFWNYRDPSGQLQGPFSVNQMQDWYSQGFFTDTLLVKRVESHDFETLGALVIRLGDAKTPFFSPPVLPKMSMPPGMGFPPVSQSPIGHRTMSPASWQQQQTSAASSRQGSISHSASAVPGNAVYDLFASHGHILAPQPTQPQGSGYGQPMAAQALPAQYEQQQQAAVLDPWGDTMPASPAVRHAATTRSSTNSPAPIEMPHKRASGLQQAHAAPGSPLPQQVQSPSASASRVSVETSRQGVSIEAPIRSTPLKQETSIAESQPLSPAAESEGQEVAAQIKATNDSQDVGVPKEAKPASTPASAVSQVVGKSVPAAQTSKPNGQQITIGKPVAAAKPDATSTPAPPKKDASASAPTKGAKVNLATQDAFDKAKQGATPPSGLEYSLAPASPASAPSANKAAPWAKPAADATPAAPAEKSKSTASLSLREIQAREAQEAAVRKAAEKKANAAAMAAQEASMAARLEREAAEALPTSSTWGSGASPAAVTVATSPWAKTTAAKKPVAGSPAPKKSSLSLKEIQEEEARQAKAKAEKAAAGQQPVGKGYAGSVGLARPSPSPAAAASGPWITVSANKPASASTQAPAVPAAPAVRPAAVSYPSAVRPSAPPATTAPAQSNAFKTVTSGAKPVSINKAGTTNGSAASASSKDDGIIPASTDLLKWCRDTLKGLDIPADDFITMLLSFPVPIDKSTRELISEMVYSSSRTLDGRYIADAFADRRTADIKAIKSGKAALPVKEQPREVKIPSMADAVKFVPAPQKQPDNFKIVTKSKGKKK